jgi:hypothetical protein
MKLTQYEFDRLKPLFYHKASPATIAKIEEVRSEFITMAVNILRSQPVTRVQSLAITKLEEVLYRTIQGIVLQEEAIMPPGIEVEQQ